MRPLPLNDIIEVADPVVLLLRASCRYAVPFFRILRSYSLLVTRLLKVPSIEQSFASSLRFSSGLLSLLVALLISCVKKRGDNRSFVDG